MHARREPAAGIQPREAIHDRSAHTVNFVYRRQTDGTQQRGDVYTVHRGRQTAPDVYSATLNDQHRRRQPTWY